MRGAVGIRIWNSHAAFDDFEVNGPGIQASAVSPSGKLAAAWGRLKGNNDMISWKPQRIGARFIFAYRRSVAPTKSLTLPESLVSGIGMSVISD